MNGRGELFVRLLEALGDVAVFGDDATQFVDPPGILLPRQRRSGRRGGFEDGGFCSHGFSLVSSMAPLNRGLSEPGCVSPVGPKVRTGATRPGSENQWKCAIFHICTSIRDRAVPYAATA